MVPLTATIPKVYVTTMRTFLSNSYDDLDETINHLKSIKINNDPGEKVEDWCDSILVDSERLDCSVSFNTKHLIYMTHIFWDNYDSRFCLWEIQK